MTDREALIAAVWAFPNEDTPRLVLADWLDEHEEAVWGGYIRAQVMMARLVAADDYDFEYVAASQIVAAVDNLTLREWVHREGIPFPEGPRLLMRSTEGDEDRLRDFVADVSIAFRRGFPDGLRCPIAFLLENARQLPILKLNRIELTDKRPFQISLRQWSWRVMEGAPGGPENLLPLEVFDCLPEREAFIAVYRSRKNAMAALSKACLSFATQAALGSSSH
jgi:uncharacterized protein (TIGR02996 family)